MGDSRKQRPTGEIQNVSSSEREEDDQSRNPPNSGWSASQPQANYPYVNQYGQQFPQGGQESFNMNALGSALPQYQNYNNAAQQRFPSANPPTALGYSIQNPQQFTGASAAHSGINSPYNLAYSAPYQVPYPSAHSTTPQNVQSGLNPTGQYYGPLAFMGQNLQQGQQFFVQPNQYMPQSPGFPIAPGAAQQSQYAGRGGYPGSQGQQRGIENLGAATGFGGPGRPKSTSSGAGHSSVVRGPPRKPRQSGHAIWIGNLPPQTDLMNLVFHVCKETKGLESLFLISKSNCAFANFKDESTCSVAQAKIHDSRFQNVRLVSRLRRNSVGNSAGSSVPTGPAALATNPISSEAQAPTPEIEAKGKEPASESDKPPLDDETALPKDKFFVVKSLTVEDLDLSVRNGIWATQSHNEEALNKAYEAADNVYLIFSANKSGEYFGYARMVSPINDDPAAAIEFAPKAQTVEDPEVPKAIPTAANDFAPKGRIIDDSARGTIFWEAERDENEEADNSEESDKSDQEDAPSAKAWGKPFKVEWVSTARLPFYRTRGLRNPWNSNREVKIARDGTELETVIGRRLLGLFHRMPNPQQPIPGNVPGQLIPGYPQPLGMRPPYV